MPSAVRSLRTRLMLTLAAGTVLVLGAIAYGITQVRGGVSAYGELLAGEVAEERELLLMVADFKKQVQEWKNVLLRGSESRELDRYWAKFEADERSVQTRGKALADALRDPQARSLVTRFLDAHRELGVAYRKGLAAYKDSGARPSAGDQAVKGIDRTPTELLEQASAALQKLSMTRAETLREQADSVVLWAAALALAAVLLLGTAIVTALGRWLVHPARIIAEDLGRIAEGDFSGAVRHQSEDELGQVASGARTLQTHLGALVRRVIESARQMAGAAADLADAASQASHTVDRQQSETEQVATAMNEMATTVEEIARGAGEAAQATEQVTRQASGGATLVGESVSGIEALASGVESAAGLVRRLAADSQSIGAVLEVIRGIAEQTNLLALNAAIEAARAGEQGRGFAVVADEVRTLAQRTQQSTREIQGSIETLQSSAADAARAMEDGQKRARASVDQIRRVAESLGKISTAVATISDLNTRMAAGAEEQSVVTNEVNRNIVNISDAGRQASQVVQRTAAASRQLSALASDMQTLTAAFKL